MNGLNDAYVESVMKKAYAEKEVGLQPREQREGETGRRLGREAMGPRGGQGEDVGAEAEEARTAQVHTRPRPSVEEIRNQREKGIETNYRIMTAELPNA